MAAGFPLELLCQLVLAYAAFKALKAAPPPRTRRKANENADVQRATAPASHAEVLRRRKIKQILKAWLVYLIATRLERVLDAFCGWWFPFYSTLRALLLFSYTFCYSSFGEIIYSHVLVPALKPYERSINWLYGFAIDILDIIYYLASSILQSAASPFLAVYHRVKRAWKLWSNDRTEANESIDNSVIDTSAAQQAAKTPKLKRTRKARISMLATPHVPGHFIASLQDGNVSIQPPIRPRLHPSERSLDDIPAFMEAMDRAQAAFYEEEEASRTQNRKEEQRADTWERKSGDANIINSKRSRRTRSQQDLDILTIEEEEVDLSPRKRRKVVTREIAAEKVTEARRKPSAKALGKRKAVSQEPDTIDDDTIPPAHKRAAIIDTEYPTTSAKPVAPASKLPRRTAAMTRSSTQVNVSESAATRIIDEKAQLAREVAAAARKAARQPKEPASRASARRKKAA